MSTTVGRADDTEAQKAAKEIADARDRANAAADAYFASLSRIDEFTVQEDQLQSEITALEGDVKALKLSVENVAIGRYTRSGSTGVPLLTGFQSPEDQVKIDALLEVIYDSSANDFDRFDALNADLADKRQKLADKKDQAEKERANLAVLKDQASAEVQRLKDVESTRLKDQAVRDALVAEQARRKRDTSRKQLLDAPTPAAVSPIDPTVTACRATFRPTTGATPVTDHRRGSQRARPTLPDAGGGQTGGGGNGSFFGGGANDYAGPGWVCPTGRRGGTVRRHVGRAAQWWPPTPGRRHDRPARHTRAGRGRRRRRVAFQRARRQHHLAHRRRRQRLLLRPPRRVQPARPGEGRYPIGIPRPDGQRPVQHRPPALRDPPWRGSRRQSVPDGCGPLPITDARDWLIATG